MDNTKKKENILMLDFIDLFFFFLSKSING